MPAAKEVPAFKLQKACSYEINDNYDDDFDEIDEDLPENDF